MSNSTDLRVSRSLELAAELRRIVTEFAKKEDQLSRDLLSRRGASSRKHRDGIERLETKLQAELGALESAHRAETERLSAIYDGRRARIERVHHAGLRALPRRAQDAKQKWMGELQLRKFRAEKKHAADTESARAAHAQASAKIGERQAALGQLEARARKLFRGYPSLLKLLTQPHAAPAEARLTFDALDTRLAAIGEQLEIFRKFGIARSFSEIPVPVLILPILMIGGVLAIVLGANAAAYQIAGATTIGLLALVFLLHHLGYQRAKPAATVIAATIGEARELAAVCHSAAAARFDEEQTRVRAEYDATLANIESQWARADDIESEFQNAARAKIETQTPRVLAKIAAALPPRLAAVDALRTGQLQRITAEADSRRRQLTEAYEGESGALNSEEKLRWDSLRSEWQQAITPVWTAVETMKAVTDQFFPEWSDPIINRWRPNSEFLPAATFGKLALDLTNGAPAKLALPGSPQVEIPLSLTFPTQGSLLIESNESGGPALLGALENIILRLLATTPPGKLTFTIIDPVGLGQSFAGLMHLADYEESLINRRIWTQSDQIEERLAELGEHIEKVIQMYLRNEYATITEYNEHAGSIAEKYHFLVIADFPANFSETAAKRLQSIVTSGARCGVFTLIHWDQRLPQPDGLVPDELHKNSVCIRREHGACTIGRAQAEIGATISLDPPPEPELAVSLVHRIGKSSIDSNRVEVPFSQIAPAPAEMWTHDTTGELRIPIGRTGATKMQYLAIGKGTRQHALFAGKTGSGKSTLFHVIITNLALACSPEQVEFYLIDFKKGVEFKCYANKRLPHARVVAIESDREFALSVLQRVDGELKRRGDLFRKLGVQDVAGYKKAGGTEPMPRSLLLIDEFQEFFVEDDTIAQTASLLLDRIVRQGRAFGIHALLGSQTLGGAYSLARATLGQMVIRVALQCNEADAYLIMDDSNPAPRLLSRPGEGIYNDAAGAIEGNSPFQVVWLPDGERDTWLDRVRTLAEEKGRRYPAPLVFEGNAPADIRDNELLASALASTPAAPPLAPRCWLGAPNSIKGPTEAVFHRQSGNHLLIVGQREEAALAILGLSMLAFAAQFPRGAARLHFFHSANPGTPEEAFIDRLASFAGPELSIVRGQEIAATMSELAAEFCARSSGERAGDAPPVFVFIHGLHRFKKLRHEDEFGFSSSDEGGAKPGAQFNDLICEGSVHGMHLLVSVDTLNNVNRFMSRKALSEFEMRVVFQMSPNDSASLIDSPKASNLGLHRALFFNEQEGHLETFRPYAIPEAEWLREAEKRLAAEEQLPK